MSPPPPPSLVWLLPTRFSGHFRAPVTPQLLRRRRREGGGRGKKKKGKGGGRVKKKKRALANVESLGPGARDYAAPKHLPWVKLASPSFASSSEKWGSGGGRGARDKKIPRGALDFFHPPPFLTKKNKNTKGAMRKRRDSFSLEKTPNSAFRWGANQSGSPGAKAVVVVVGGCLFTLRGEHSKELFRHHNNINNNNKRLPVSLRSAASPESVGDGSAGPQTPRAPLRRPPRG